MPPRASEAARVRTDRRAGFRFCMMLSCLSASTVTMFGSVVVARGVVHGIVDCFGPHARGHHLVEEFPTHLLRALVERAGCGRLGPVALGGVDVGGHEPGTEAGDPTPVSRGACGESAGRGHSITQRVITTPAPARPLGNGPSRAPHSPVTNPAVWDTSVAVVDRARPFRCDSCAVAVNASFRAQWAA